MGLQKTERAFCYNCGGKTEHTNEVALKGEGYAKEPHRIWTCMECGRETDAGRTQDQDPGRPPMLARGEEVKFAAENGPVTITEVSEVSSASRTSIHDALREAEDNGILASARRSTDGYGRDPLVFWAD